MSNSGKVSAPVAGGGVHVLDVLLDAAREGNRWDYPKVMQARAAVAELIAAAKRVMDGGLDTDSAMTQSEWAEAMDARAALRAAISNIEGGSK